MPARTRARIRPRDRATKTSIRPGRLGPDGLAGVVATGLDDLLEVLREVHLRGDRSIIHFKLPRETHTWGPRRPALPQESVAIIRPPYWRDFESFARDIRAVNEQLMGAGRAARFCVRFPVGS